MSHVVTQAGATRAFQNTVGYIGEILNALSSFRLLQASMPQAPTAGLAGDLLGGLQTDPLQEEVDVWREWLVSTDIPFNPGSLKQHRIPARFWTENPPPIRNFQTSLMTQFLSQDKNTRRRKVVSHRT